MGGTSKWADNRQATNFECTLTPCDLNCGFLLTNSDVYYANQDFSCAHTRYDFRLDVFDFYEDLPNYMVNISVDQPSMAPLGINFVDVDGVLSTEEEKRLMYKGKRTQIIFNLLLHITCVVTSVGMFGYESRTFKDKIGAIALISFSYADTVMLLLFLYFVLFVRQRYKRLNCVILSLQQSPLIRGDFICRMDSVGVTTVDVRKAVDANEGLLFVDIMPHGTTINSDGYVATLKKLQVRLSRVRRHREKQDVLLLHDIAQPYGSHKTTDQIRKFG
ncbi:hypothetical protein ANN_00443 [Periplaneta americana]|uniref:Uncharacterized protein n=1 Tax=Periplaneta americana TaxID=6978 RepID=A0ABQ8TRY6_PERAM|nr:hypothetical protein ANN_00443 [Periplaneta americana]